MQMKLIRISFLLTLSVFLCVESIQAQAQQDSTAQQIYLKAVKNLENGEYYAAQSQLQEAVALDSTHQAATLELMRVYYAQRNFEGAENLAQRLVNMYPKEESNWVALADIYKATENYDGLLGVFDQLIQLKSDNSSYYYDKALTLTLQDKVAEALDLYSQIEKKFGLEDRLFIARKDIYIHQNNPKKAISEAKAFISFKPEDSHPYLLLANVYLDLKKPKDALKVLNGLEEKFPAEPYVFLTRADAYKSLNKDNQVFIELKKAFAMESLPIDIKIRTIYNVFQDFDKNKSLAIAEELSQMLAESNPQQANAQAVYGDVLLQKGDLDKAHVYLLKALTLNKKLDFIWSQLLQLEISQGNYVDAQKHGLEAINLFPTNSGILLFTGYAYLLDKKYDEARAFLEESLNQANPENAALMVQVYSSLGDTYHALNLHAESNVAYEEALAIDSNNTYVLNNFAYYLALRKEELSKAASMSKKSNELDPGNASFQDTYAWVLFQQGNYQEALSWIDKAIALAENPTATLIEHKGDILFKLGNKEEALKLWEEAAKFTEVENKEILNKKIKEKVYVD